MDNDNRKARDTQSRTFRPLSRQEQEIIIRRCADDDFFDIDCTIPNLTVQLERLAILYDVPVQASQHGIRARFPRRAIAFRKPPTAAQRQKGERLAAKQWGFTPNAPHTSRDSHTISPEDDPQDSGENLL